MHLSFHLATECGPSAHQSLLYDTATTPLPLQPARPAQPMHPAVERPREQRMSRWRGATSAVRGGSEVCVLQWQSSGESAASALPLSTRGEQRAWREPGGDEGNNYVGCRCVGGVDVSNGMQSIRKACRSPLAEQPRLPAIGADQMKLSLHIAGKLRLWN
jgi:hypothetical protein